MDRNTVTGLVLIAIILVVYSMYNASQMEDMPVQSPSTADSTIVEDTNPKLEELQPKTDEFEETEEEPTTSLNQTIDSLKRLQEQEELGPFALAANGEEQLVTLENDKIKVVLSSKGGTIHSVELKEYQTSDSLPLILFEGEDSHKNIQFFIQNNRVVNTHDLYFDIASQSDDKVVFEITTGDNSSFEQVYSLNEKDYLIDYNININGISEIMPVSSNYLNLYWKRQIRQLEKSKENENRYTETHYKYAGEDVESLSQTEDDEESLTTSISWVSFKQQFFNSTLISKNNFSSGTVKSKMLENEQEPYLKTMEASLVLPIPREDDINYSMQYYYGPNHYQTLKSLKIDLDEIVMVTGFMSWVSFISKWIIIPLFNFLNQFISNYGIIILILTLLIKLALAPLTYKSYKSAAMMKALKPELDALKEKTGDDQQKFAQEQWKLYQKAGVSPLGGCLPMLLQMPILIAMYYFFPTSIELRQESFLWASDLSTYDSIANLPFTIPFYGDHVSLFTLLMGVSSILYGATNAQMSQGPASMKYMPYIFPVMMLFIFNSFPAALTYYYFLANMITFAQQYITKKFFIDEAALHKKIQENKKKPSKKSGFQKRLENLAKQQREIQKQRGKKK